MAPPTLTSNPSFTLTPTPLTPASFAPFGHVISSPLPRDLPSAPATSTLAATHMPLPTVANQGSALKYTLSSQMGDGYKDHCASGKEASALMSVFSSFPRQLRPPSQASASTAGKAAPRGLFDVRILERHPYTTQTFVPTDLSSQAYTSGDGKSGTREPVFIVMVAPTLEGQAATAKLPSGEQVTVQNPPDLSNLKAFVARGGQAVTYGPGTWHAPMVVVGQRRVDFVVVQYANGVGEEDCQEVAFDQGIVLEINADTLEGSIKSKL